MPYSLDRSSLILAFAIFSLGAVQRAQCQCSGMPPPTSSEVDPNPPTPAGPSTPAPATPGPGNPSTPQPAGPTTPGPGQPALGSPTPRLPGATTPRSPGHRGRVPITFTRGQTSRNLLQIDWDHPVHQLERAPAAPTASFPRRRALPPAQAYGEVRGDDPRPLLILRECNACKGSDRALLRARVANDRTILLSHWFHCVKLPADVITPGHPYGSLFAGKGSAHLFLSSWDGDTVVLFSGTQSPSDLWKAMAKVLTRDYAGDPKARMNKVLRLLEQFDRWDEQEARLAVEFDRLLETKGPRNPEVPKVQKKLAKILDTKKRLKKELEALRNLPLRPQETASGGGGEGN